MRSLWNDTDAARCSSDLELRVYSSRLLGREPALVLFGGGNTSVKTTLNHRCADQEQVLCVKASGADLAAVTEADFTPVRLAEVQQLIRLKNLDNAGLMNAVSATVAEPGRPRPSIETLLHAVLPFKFVEHTHADSVLAITNTVQGAPIAAEVFGDLAPLVPFHESGFALARACHEVYCAQAAPAAIGLILLHHGVFAFGNTARESYENMLRLVTLAENYLMARKAWGLPRDEDPESWTPAEVAQLRRDISRAAGFPLLLEHQDSAECRAFARRTDLAELCGQGPATPQHAVFAKRVPLLGRDVESYAKEYAAYVSAHRPGASLEALRLDPGPRVVIDPQMGVWTAGIDAHHAGITGEIFRHDLEIMTRAAAHDRYAGLPVPAILDAEIHYGGFEWRMRQRAAEETAFLGESVLMTGSGNLLARPLVQALLRRGAAVTILDELEGGADWPASEAFLELGTTPLRVASIEALRELVGRFGGLDILILQPGFEAWLPLCAELLSCAPRGGRLALLGPLAWCERTRSIASELAVDHSFFVVAWPLPAQPGECGDAVDELCSALTVA